jgi:hypothetical protein
MGPWAMGNGDAAGSFLVVTKQILNVINELAV